jgi:hypothetical protein
MKKSLILCSLAASGLALASASAASAKDNWVGTWNLNLAKSKFKPGPPLKSQTLKFESAADGVKLTGDGVDAEGKTMHTEYVSKFDGTEVPWSGNPNADSASPKRIDSNHYRNIWKKDGKVTITADVMVSKDGKTLTVTQTGKDAKGRVMDTVEVFDRQ